MTETPLFGFRLVAGNASEAAKIAAANENALLFESLFKQQVISRTTSVPPGAPADGAAYIVSDPAASPAPSGAWAGHGNEIAIFYNGWLFALPVQGPRFWVNDESVYVHYDVTASPDAWAALGGVNDAIHDNVAGEFAAITEKVAPVDDDLLLLEDSENANVKRKVKKSSVGASSVMARVSRTTDFSPADASNTPVLWNVNDIIDRAGMHSTSVNTARIICDQAGRYRFTLKLMVDANTTEQRYQAWASKNRNLGPDTPPVSFFNDIPGLLFEGTKDTTSGASGYVIFSTDIVEMALDDYIEWIVWASPATVFEFENSFAIIEYLGP